jgi:hypothetical protein
MLMIIFMHDFKFYWWFIMANNYRQHFFLCHRRRLNLILNLDDVFLLARILLLQCSVVILQRVVVFSSGVLYLL